MNITFIVPILNISGGLRVISIYAELLQKKGHTITVVTPRQKRATFKQKIKHFMGWKGYRFNSGFDLTYFNNISYNIIVANGARAVVNNDVPNADIVIATWWETFEWINEFSVEKGELVYFVQGLETLNAFQPKLRVEATYKSLVPKITVAKWLVNELNDRSSADVYLVPNSVEHDTFYSNKRTKQRSPTIGFLFSETGSKGVAVALEVLVNLKKLYPELRVLSFGAYQAELIDLPSYMELIIKPEKSEIRDLYAQCDVWLCCSTLEGFGLTVLEAMACRTPVVSTKCGGPEDIITDGVNGYLCEVGDVSSLVLAVQKVLDLDNLSWNELSSAAYQYSRNYSWNAAAVLFEKSLVAILKNKE